MIKKMILQFTGTIEISLLIPILISHKFLPAVILLILFYHVKIKTVITNLIKTSII